MTDKDLAMLLTDALDERIVRAEAAPVTRTDGNRMPPAEAVASSLVRAVPVKQLRWKGAIAAVLALVLMGGAALAAAQLLNQRSHEQPADSGQVEETQTDPEKTAQVTEPIDPAELPQVVYDADSRTIRISGTTGYDRLDLSPYLDDALNLEVEDDRFQLSVVLSVIENYTDQANLNLADYLPGYLDRLDHSLAFVGQYIAEHAPKEETVENTRKPVEVMVTGQRNRFNSIHSDKVTLSLASYFRHHGSFYTLALMNSETVEWQQLGYAYWVGFLKDPYNSVYAVGNYEEDLDYFYFKDYLRLGGTLDPRDLNNQALLHDANAWYNLIYGRDWDGNMAECRPISDLGEFHGVTGSSNNEGNDLCLIEAISLLNYLAKQYGEEQVAAFCFDTCSFEEAFGTDFATARAAWEQSLLDRFGDGSENPAELPQVSFDKDTKTLRIVGTGNYDRVDLSRLPDAETLIVEDDDFSYTILPALLYGDDSSIKDDVAGYLPGYLDRVDKSLATIRQFVADTAPNEDVIAQTQKPVKLELKRFKSESYGNSENQIELDLGSGYRWHGPFYTMALMDPESAEWQHIGYAYWVGLCLDPYCSIYTKTGSVVPPDPDYAYNADYYRLGGTEDWRDLNNQRLLADANSWYNLVYGTTWGGLEAERGCVSNSQWFNSKNRTKEGNKRPLTEAVSLLNYLAEQYGADKVTAYCFDTCSFEEAFGMDYATARAAWEQSLMERFGNGSENP